MLTVTHQSLATCEPITINIRECELEQVNSSHHLGMKVDENTNWNRHSYRCMTMKLSNDNDNEKCLICP